MKRPAWKTFAWLALAPLAAFADVRGDYVQQWPLTLAREDAGAYRVALDEEVYRQVQSHALKDLDVIDADGVAVASALFGAKAPSAQPARAQAVPWFPLQVGAGGDARELRDLSLVVERDADGAVRGISAAVSLHGETSVATQNPTWLIDLSRIREPVAALVFDWSPPDAPLDLSYRLEASDDLRDWRVLDAQVRLVDLNNREYRLQHKRVAVGRPARYLRLVPLRKAAAPEIRSVRAELAAVPGAVDWHWVELAGERLGDPAGGDAFHFDTGGRFPAEVVDVVLPGNAAVGWTLQSRDSASPQKNGPLMNPDAAWRTHAHWVSYRLSDPGGELRSPAQVLPRAPVRDRYWTLRADRAIAGPPPKLRLGYRPEALVFLAQGTPPYTLVAGSRRAQRADAPLPQLMEAQRKQHGESWQPPEATLGPMRLLAGKTALQPKPPQRDWKNWLLWGLLVAGALLVAGLAFSLLKGSRAPQ